MTPLIHSCQEPPLTDPFIDLLPSRTWRANHLAFQQAHAEH